jgi:hypothetical protein
MNLTRPSGREYLLLKLLRDLKVALQKNLNSNGNATL